MLKSLIGWCCFLLFPVLAAGQEDRMKVKATLEPKEAAVGDTIKLKLKLDIKAGYHTYPTVQNDPNASAFITNIRVRSGPLEAAGTAKEPKPNEKYDQDLKVKIGTLEGTVEIEVPFKVKKDTPAGKAKVSIRVQTQVCNETNCLPFNETFEFEMDIKPGAK
jgi:DsbC/DsbD-like thiol-disulfide interchange protein